MTNQHGINLMHEPFIKVHNSWGFPDNISHSNYENHELHIDIYIDK